MEDYSSEEKREDVVWRQYALAGDVIQVLKYYKPCWTVEGDVVTTIGEWKCVECDVPITRFRKGFRLESESTLWETPMRRTVSYEFEGVAFTGK